MAFLLQQAVLETGRRSRSVSAELGQSNACWPHCHSCGTSCRASFSSRIALVPTSQHERRGSARTGAIARAWYFSPCVRLRSAIAAACYCYCDSKEPITFTVRMNIYLSQLSIRRAA